MGFAAIPSFASAASRLVLMKPKEKPPLRKIATSKKAARASAGRSANRIPSNGATRDPERTAATILAAAVREFGEKGYGGARIDAIAERSGANKRMIYHYFGDKEALYLAVLEQIYAGIRSAELRLNLRNLEPIPALHKLVRFTWDYFLEHPEFLSLLHTENLHKAKYLKRSARAADLNSPLIALISEILQRGVAKGEFRTGVDPLKLYITIASVGFFYLSNRWTLSVIFRRDLTTDAEIKAWGSHIISVIDAYVGA
jgi:AcrR family transcriptional regulator